MITIRLIAKTSLLIQALITLIILTDVVTGECGPGKWSSKVKKATCHQEGFELVYVEKIEDRFVALCCDDENSVRMIRRGIHNKCYTTPCTEGPVRNLCLSVTQPFFMEGKRVELELEEAMRDSCKDPVTRKKGTSVICCPKNSLGALLISLSSAEEDEFPHMARSEGCGGTVYNKDYIISAAHCFVNTKTGKPRKPKEVLLGTNLGNIHSKNNTFGVEKFIIHQDFSLLANHSEKTTAEYPRIFNDIALLKLNRSIKFKNTGIRALELAPPEFNPELYSDQLLITGYGTTSLGIGSEHLQKSNLIIRSNQTCFSSPVRYPTYKEFSSQLQCAGGIVGKSISNQAGTGDSGGPAVCRGRDGSALLCGVTSFGSGYDESECVENNHEKYCTPTVFTDVSYFRKWIIDNAGEQDLKTLHRAKLYGDQIREKGKYAHQVHIWTEDGKMCGGTLISQEIVVTAAQCVKTDDGHTRPGIEINTPIRNLRDRIPAKHVFKPVDISIPPKFSRVKALDALKEVNGRRVLRDSLYVHDIAIIKLGRQSRIKTAKLPRLPLHSKFEVGNNAVEISFPVDTSRSAQLRQRNFKILTREDCVTRLKRFRALGSDVTLDTEQVMCGVEVYSGGSTCDREIGGGLICEDEDGFDVLCGIQTFRLCETTLPNFFLNVGKYLELINKMMEVEEPSTLK